MIQKAIVIAYKGSKIIFATEPKPVCVVFHEINSGKTQKIWLEGKNPLSFNPPYPMGEDSLFIAYYSSAEWGCHLALNWPLPINVIDIYQNTGKPRMDFLGCLRAFWGRVNSTE